MDLLRAGARPHALVFLRVTQLDAATARRKMIDIAAYILLL